MSAKPVPKAFEGFKRLGTSTYLFEPPSAKPRGESAPDLILLCAWLDAQPKHIAKYSEGYKALYPHARILLVTTSFAEMSFNGRKGERARVEPVVQVLLAGAPEQKILLEFFSNGGAHTACYVAREYKARTGGRLLPVGAQIMDSSPGQWDYARVMAALSVSLPRPFLLRWLGYVFLHLFISWYIVITTITGREYFITVLRRQLNDKTLFSRAAPRLYFYSRTDEMVALEHVETHADEAKAKGYPVTKEEFVGSAHCGHMMKGPERYWAAVKAVWEQQ